MKKTTIFLFVVLCCSQANAQYSSYNNSGFGIGNYIQQIERQSNWANAAFVNAAYNNRYNNGDYGNNYRRQRSRQTAADLYNHRIENLRAKQEYDQALKDSRLKSRELRIEMIQEMAVLKKQEEDLRDQGLLPPRKPSSIGINGKFYPSYKTFLATNAGKQWLKNK